MPERIEQERAVRGFFGRCEDGEPVAGRAEHTDAVEHDGTWHLQCAGRKVWHLRPTDALIGSGGAKAAAGVRVEVEPGDVLLFYSAMLHGSTGPGINSTFRRRGYERDALLQSVIERSHSQDLLAPAEGARPDGGELLGGQCCVLLHGACVVDAAASGARRDKEKTAGVAGSRDREHQVCPAASRRE